MTLNVTHPLITKRNKMIVLNISKKNSYIQIGEDIVIAFDRKRAYIKAPKEIEIKRMIDNENNIFRFRDNKPKSDYNRNLNKLLFDDELGNNGDNK